MVGKKGLQGEPPGKHLPADSWLSWYANNPFCIKIDSTSKAVMLEKTLESPLDCKKIIRINPKGYQGWIFLGRTDAEAETPILWPPDWKSWLIGKNPDSGKDWRQEEKEMTEDDMVGWHHWLDGHEFEREAWRTAVHGVAKSWILLSHWKTPPPPLKHLKILCSLKTGYKHSSLSFTLLCLARRLLLRI